MKRKIRVYAIFALTIIGFFLPFVLIALGCAFSWTIAIVAGIVGEIGLFFIFWALVWNILDLNDELEIANRKVELQKEAGYMTVVNIPEEDVGYFKDDLGFHEDLYNNLVQKNKEESK